MVDTSVYFDLIARDKASATIKGVGVEAGKSSSKMEKFHKVGAAAGVALAGGLLLAGKAAVEMTKRAAEDQAAAAKLAQTLHTAAHATDAQVASTEDWITAQGKALGVADDELRPALSKLAVATGSVSKAQKLASLAMDVSAGSGKSLESVSFALAKAQNGNVAGLSRLGIATTNAAGETLSLEAITRKMADTYRGAASSAAETAAGKQKIMTVQISELQEKIGYALIPVMEKLVAVGMKVIDWIDNNTKLAGILVGAIGALLAVTVAVSAATKLWATYQALSTAATKAAAAGQWLLNAAMTANPIGLVVVAIAALVVGLVIAYKKSETFRNIVNGAFHSVQKVVGAVVGFVKDHWEAVLILLTGGTGLAVVGVIKNFDKIVAAVKMLGKWAGWLWNNAFQPALRFIVNGISFLLQMWGKMLSALGHVPGFGWADKAADAMFAAANRASDLANKIRDIPSSKRVDVNVYTHHIGRPGVTDPDLGAGRGGGAGGGASAGRTASRDLSSGSGGGAGRGGGSRDLGTFTLDLKLDGRTVQKVLLKLKNENGGLDLGLT